METVLTDLEENDSEEITDMRKSAKFRRHQQWRKTMDSEDTSTRYLMSEWDENVFFARLCARRQKLGHKYVKAGQEMEPDVRDKIEKNIPLTKDESRLNAPSTYRNYRDALINYANFMDYQYREMKRGPFTFERMFTFYGPDQIELRDPWAWWDTISSPNIMQHAVAAIQELGKMILEETRKDKALEQFRLGMDGKEKYNLEEANKRRLDFKERLKDTLTDITNDKLHKLCKDMAHSSHKRKVEVKEQLDTGMEGSYADCIRRYMESDYVRDTEKKIIQDFDNKAKVHSPKELKEIQNFVMVYGYLEAGNRTQSLNNLSLKDWIARSDGPDVYKQLHLDSTVDQNSISHRIFNQPSGTSRTKEFIGEPDDMINIDPHPDEKDPKYKYGLEVKLAKIKLHKTPDYPLYLVFSQVFNFYTIALEEFMSRTYESASWVKSLSRPFFCSSDGTTFAGSHRHVSFEKFDKIGKTNTDTTPTNLRTFFSSLIYNSGKQRLNEAARFAQNHGDATAIRHYIREWTREEPIVEVHAYYRQETGAAQVFFFLGLWGGVTKTPNY